MPIILFSFGSKIAPNSCRIRMFMKNSVHFCAFSVLSDGIVKQESGIR